MSDVKYLMDVINTSLKNKKDSKKIEQNLEAIKTSIEKTMLKVEDNLENSYTGINKINMTKDSIKSESAFVAAHLIFQLISSILFIVLLNTTEGFSMKDFLLSISVFSFTSIIHFGIESDWNFYNIKEMFKTFFKKKEHFIKIEETKKIMLENTSFYSEAYAQAKKINDKTLVELENIKSTIFELENNISEAKYELFKSPECIARFQI